MTLTSTATGLTGYCSVRMTADQQIAVHFDTLEHQRCRTQVLLTSSPYISLCVAMRATGYNTNTNTSTAARRSAM